MSKQTAEQAAAEYVKSIYPQYCAPLLLEDLFIAGTNWQAAQSPWIDVKDALPKKPGHYICWCSNEYKIIHFHPKKGWLNGLYNNRVTHWQLPEPPTK